MEPVEAIESNLGPIISNYLHKVGAESMQPCSFFSWKMAIFKEDMTIPQTPLTLWIKKGWVKAFLEGRARFCTTRGCNVTGQQTLQCCIV